jgi:hypothetical protein
VRLALCGFILLTIPASAGATDYVFKGPWKTTNRKLDGVMTSIVTPLADQQWDGRFFGSWQGIDFDYKVKFQGPPEHLQGVATIEGAEYEWRGRINGDLFRVNFGGDRYEGSFELKRTTLSAAQAIRQDSPATDSAKTQPSNSGD